MSTITTPKKYQYFIGTDVGGKYLDHVVMRGAQYLYHSQTLNTEAAISEFLAELKKLPRFSLKSAVFCMEQTGVYCTHLLTVLRSVNAHIVLENPLHIRNSLGYIRGKNDKLDAARIAEFAYRNRENLRLWEAKREIINQLAGLMSLRIRLLGLHTALKTPLSQQKGFLKGEDQDLADRLCLGTMTALKKDIAAAEKAMQQLIDSDERLRHLYAIVTSVRSVGPLTALQLLICTNEFKDISDPKKFACYAGIAPFPFESGTFRGRARVSHVANKRMKGLLHICAISALQKDPELKSYYERKTKGEGKHKMSVLNAVRYKMALRIFACVRQDRMFEKDYVRPGPSRVIVADPCTIE